MKKPESNTTRSATVPESNTARSATVPESSVTRSATNPADKTIPPNETAATITTSAADPAEGFDGILYPASLQNGRLRHDKAVITLSGSEGGLQNAERMARFLQQHGIPALALGYFRTANTGRELSRIPLEYIEKAVRWLQNLGYAKIAVQGISRGAEYAAAAAVHFSEITCAILRAPSWFYGEGLTKNNPSGASCWTFRGEELPYAPFAERSFTQRRRREKTGNIEKGSAKPAPLLTAATDAGTCEKAAIPLEKICGPVLFVSTEADTVLPSVENARKLETRLAESGFDYPHEHICYRHMSHIMLENASRFAREVFASEKEYPAECAAEREAMGQATIRWLEDVWK